MSKSEKSAYFCHIFANSFLWCLFKNFLNGFEISVKFCVFDTHIEYFTLKMFLLSLALFLNFELKCEKNGSKREKKFL
jgi:hypothetical protein